MGHHYHFVMHTRSANLSLLMRHINGVYSPPQGQVFSLKIPGELSQRRDVEPPARRVPGCGVPRHVAR